MKREALKKLREALNLSSQTPIEVKGKLPEDLCHIHAYNEWRADCHLCAFDKK